IIMANSSDLNVVVDVVVPVVFVISLFIINGFVLRFIMRKRREYQELEAAAIEEPTTSASASGIASAAVVSELPPVASAPVAETDDSCSIEMERL
ncbi:hypothetical protein KR044_004607, partial [Drosophila immigrans]